MIALITGATSGIGAEFARRFAQQGYDLILTGRRKNDLEQTAEAIRTSTGRNVTAIVGNLAEPHHRQELTEMVQATNDLDVLVNNAGYGLKKHFIEDEMTNVETLLDVHLNATLQLTHAALPGMMSRKRGTVINVSSMAGFSPTASDPTYGATKAFLTLFTESLHLVVSAKGIRMQALCPGLTWTDFHERLGIPKSEQTPRGILRWTTSEKVVNASFAALEKGKVVCIPGFLNRLAIRIVKYMPRSLYYAIMKGKTLRRR